jgi:hypothetical protein
MNPPLASNLIAMAAALAAVVLAFVRGRRSTAWPAALFVVGLPVLLLLPEYLTVFSSSRWGWSVRNVAADAAPFGMISLYGLVAEVLVAMAMAFSLVWTRASREAGDASSA